jgi:opacity protein-like surface antigen
LTVAMLATAAIVTPASGGDLSNRGPGGIKDYGQAGVPVPAPVPYEEHFKYYMGGGIGWTARSSGSASLNADAANKALGDGYGAVEGPPVYSLMIGRYLTPSVRLELGLDLRAPHKIVKSPQYYNATLTAPSATLGATTDKNVYDVTRVEDAKAQNHTMMVNGFYEFSRGGRFTPYVGAGIGLSLLRVTRTSTESAVCTQGSTDGVTLAPGACHNSFLMPAAADYGARGEKSGVGVAAALMAGLTYNLSDRTHLDVGYRMMWQGAAANIIQPSLGGMSSLTLGSRLDHEVRTSVRVDLW